MAAKLVLLLLLLCCGGKEAARGGEPDAYREQALACAGEVLDGSAAKVQRENIAEKDRFLLLVNKENPLPEGYQVELRAVENGKGQVDVEVFDALKRMVDDAKAEGLQIIVGSSYRDVEYQRGLLEEDIRNLMAQGKSYDEAYAVATEETMPPGYSEHSTGYAVDLVSLGYQVLDERQESTPEIQWLQQHCAEYGFILRYPKGKEEVTEINYESWHFRYVGPGPAREIEEAGSTLEEYLQDLTEPAAAYFAGRLSRLADVLAVGGSQGEDSAVEALPMSAYSERRRELVQGHLAQYGKALGSHFSQISRRMGGSVEAFRRELSAGLEADGESR